ncbi:unnamed protein product [Penicillium nalgiovense]|uniref:Uncharacterized protein n=1 Tax=Penicillium nalgiovense TaxID=60175 RepID=A0A9W4HG66_PENNA|nr:unnamed protein product [Penicillium nalgiovense]CAG7937427.1 unnamed protein product [Penicillium nalgiovense]CAG7939321.1 unnamed protein product [Penicillium nalgiovense]CAG7939946.1 unnamed protein product [Penicillium nalgiovense]CAG7941846.1 unnamed protein product [Penicillium nalgiovense]
MSQENPLRVLVIVSHRSSQISKAQNNPEALVPKAIRLLKASHLYSPQEIHPATKLVAAQKWRTRVFFVFDICHTAYDAKLGHLPEQNKLPVAVVHLSKKNTAYVANAWLSKRVNRDIALFHNANGFGAVPPFVEDHTVGKPPEYMNPRDISLLRASCV